MESRSDSDKGEPVKLHLLVTNTKRGFCRLFCLAAFIALVLLSSSVFAQTPETVSQSWAWVGTPSSGNSDSVSAIATDAAGNVYFTGQRLFPAQGVTAFVGKLSIAGAPTWESILSLSEGDSDFYRIGMDGADNVIACGTHASVATGTDFVIAKHDQNGNEIWVKTHSSTGAHFDFISDMHVTDEGDVYVTGTVFQRSQFPGLEITDIATIKYNASGEKKWLTQYNSPLNNSESGAALAVDGAGNVYVAGTQAADLQNTELVVIKYDSFGNELWTTPYAGPVPGPNVAVDIALSGDSGVYLLGRVDAVPGNQTDNNWAVVKFDTAGNFIWETFYDGPDPDPSDDVPVKMAVASSGAVAVTGNTLIDLGQASFYDIATVLFDANGDLLWTRTLAGAAAGYDSGVDIFVDQNDRIYVTGYISEQSDFISANDIVTAAYALSGETLWQTVYTSTNPVGDDIPSSLTMDNQGNILVGGSCWTGDTQQNSSLVIKYTQDDYALGDDDDSDDDDTDDDDTDDDDDDDDNDTAGATPTDEDADEDRCHGGNCG
jgi:hypothetical protein